MTGHSNGQRTGMNQWNRLNHEFYTGTDVLLIARNLLGCKLVSRVNGALTSGIITETEAYAGETDRASHAYGGRRTNRTETMYQEGGLAYIYLCYGIHSLFNVVTNFRGTPHAVLIRAIFPLEGIPVMQERLQREIIPDKDGSGPGKVTRLLAVDRSLNGINLIFSNQLWIESSQFRFHESKIRTTCRIGVDYAGEDALLPYRYVIDGAEISGEIKKAGLI